MWPPILHGSTYPWKSASADLERCWPMKSCRLYVAEDLSAPSCSPTPTRLNSYLSLTFGFWFYKEKGVFF